MRLRFLAAVSLLTLISLSEASPSPTPSLGDDGGHRYQKIEDKIAAVFNKVAHKAAPVIDPNHEAHRSTRPTQTSPPGTSSTAEGLLTGTAIPPNITGTTTKFPSGRYGASTSPSFSKAHTSSEPTTPSKTSRTTGRTVSQRSDPIHVMENQSSALPSTVATTPLTISAQTSNSSTNSVTSPTVLNRSWEFEKLTTSTAFSTIGPEISKRVSHMHNIRKVLGMYWHLHVFFFGILYVFFTLICLFSIVRILTSNWVNNKCYLTIVLSILVIWGISQSTLLLSDTYSVQGKVSPILINILHDLNLPCICAAFAMLFLEVLQDTQVRFARVFIQSPVTVCGVITLHLLVTFITDFLVDGPHVVFLLANVVHLVWILLLAIAYISVFRKVHVSALRIEADFSHEIFIQSYLEGRTRPKSLPKPVLSTAVKVMFFIALVKICMAVIIIFGLLFVFGPYDNKSPLPWPWWGYQITLGALETIISFLTAFSVIGPLKGYHLSLGKALFEHRTRCSIYCMYSCGSGGPSSCQNGNGNFSSKASTLPVGRGLVYPQPGTETTADWSPYSASCDPGTRANKMSFLESETSNRRFRKLPNGHFTQVPTFDQIRQLRYESRHSIIAKDQLENSDQCINDFSPNSTTRKSNHYNWEIGPIYQDPFDLGISTIPSRVYEASRSDLWAEHAAVNHQYFVSANPKSHSATSGRTLEKKSNASSVTPDPRLTFISTLPQNCDSLAMRQESYLKRKSDNGSSCKSKNRNKEPYSGCVVESKQHCSHNRGNRRRRATRQDVLPDSAAAPDAIAEGSRRPVYSSSSSEAYEELRIIPKVGGDGGYQERKQRAQIFRSLPKRQCGYDEETRSFKNVFGRTRRSSSHYSLSCSQDLDYSYSLFPDEGGGGDGESNFSSLRRSHSEECLYNQAKASFVK